METLDYNQLLLVSLWQYNHHGDEGLTPALFEETFGKVYGSHYYEKWTGYFNRKARAGIWRECPSSPKSGLWRCRAG